jgi:EmrB/QacA subfamily drug resistance transporter
MPTVITSPCDEGVIRSRKSAAPCTKAQARWILAATIIASSMAFIDGTVVNVALPALQKHLAATAIGVQWVVEAYALFLSALLLVGGSLGDQYGRRLIFVIGVILFAVASAWCGIAPNIEHLIAARAVQGVGAALLVPGSLAIISASFPREERGRAIGTWSGFSAITTAIGPVFGGWLVDNVSWRAVFFLNLPLAAAVVLISLWRVPESRDRKSSGRIDWMGATLATLGLAGVVFGLIESSRLTLFARPVIASLLAGAIALAAFVVLESRVKSPMVPLSLFRSRNFAGANLLTLLLYFSLGGGLFFLTLNLIQAQGFSATAAGATLLPFVVLMFSLSRWSGGLIERVGARLPLIVGPLIAAVGFAMFALPGLNASYWTGFLPAVLVLGFGMSIAVAPLTTTVMSSVSEEQAGVASGINNAVARTAGLLAVAVLGVVMLNVFSSELDGRLTLILIPESRRSAIYDQRINLGGIEVDGKGNERPGSVTNQSDDQKQSRAETPVADHRNEIQTAIKESFVSGYRVVMIIAAVLAALGGLMSWIFIENR